MHALNRTFYCFVLVKVLTHHPTPCTSSFLTTSTQTPHQYLLITSSPEKEAIFQELKAKHGSKFAFHGSPVENWHSILRDGLQAKYVLNGRAHGDGVYLAPSAGTSLSYSNIASGGGASYGMSSSGSASAVVKRAPSAGDNQFLSTSDLKMLALCEVIDDPETVSDVGKDSFCWVAKENNRVVTRFFFVYCGLESGKSGVDMQSVAQLNSVSPKFAQEIAECIARNSM
jgi:hypothetical protein